MRGHKVVFPQTEQGKDLMLDRSITQPEVSPQTHNISYSDMKEHIQLVDVLAELHELLEEYAPTWYTEEHRKKIQAALRSQKES